MIVMCFVIRRLLQAGFTLGIFLTLLIAGLELYTCTLVLRLAQVMRDEQLDQNNVQQVVEFSDLCRYFINARFGNVATVISVITILTASVAYWILMSGFLFNIGQSIFEFSVTNATQFLNATVGPIGATPITSFETIWTTKLTPVLLVAVVYPLCLIRNPAVFQKLNSLGVISIVYFVIFIAVKAASWGINYDACKDPSIKDWNLSFPALTGTITLGFFVHNAVIAMTNQAAPSTRIRDLGYGYLLVLVTYLYIGISVYITFPDAKSTIRDNILKNFASTDVLAFVARVGLLFQMSATFPLIVYIARLQLIKVLFGRNENLLLWRAVVAAGVIALGLLAAVFFPNIGAVLR
ncbi:hypothetical protein RvY_16152-2 [Ramazzottius varieornatus]|uniref:Amino acid transporter transmembrane domain-containing protein n=1 Tax=Ramazzottius varieornatus TaxID=947166 RepID=A0A1D1VYF5_RAMVA|nr:hypothetical protein RvY_16152-2 [Ramazzottius varieornatus]